MTFAYEIHYSVNLKLCKVKRVAEYETVERKVKKSCGLVLCWLCEERQWVWPLHRLHHGVAQWISPVPLSTLVLYLDCVFRMLSYCFRSKYVISHVIVMPNVRVPVA